MFRAAAETVKIAWSWILLSNKKTAAFVGTMVRGRATGRAQSEEKKRGGARAYGRAN